MRRHEPGDADDGIGLPDDERLGGAQTRAVEQRGPVDAGRFLVEVGTGPMIVGLGDIGRLGARPMHRRNLALEIVDARRSRCGVGHLSQREQVDEMRAIGRPYAVHLVAAFGVVVAIGQSQSALQQVGHLAGRVVQILREPEAEDAIGIEVGRVERVDVGAKVLADPSRQRPPIGNRRDVVERRVEWRDAALLDRRLVQVARVVVANLALVGSGGRLARRCLFEQPSGALLRLLAENVEDAVARAIGWNLRVLEPGSVRIVIEVVARGDRHVHRRVVDVVLPRRGRIDSRDRFCRRG